MNVNQDVLFFFTNGSPLETDAIEFHKQKSTSEINQNHSYIYLIFELKHAQVSQIQDFLEEDVFAKELQLMGDEFKNPLKAQELLKNNAEEIEKSLAYFYQMSTFK